MTVSTTLNKQIFPGNGATVTFNFSFAFPQGTVPQVAADLQVIYTDTLGNQTTLVEGPGSTQYQLFLNAPAGSDPTPVGGTVIYSPPGGPIATGTTLTVYRNLPVVQPSSFANQGTLYQPAIEQALDYLAMLDQQAIEIQSRAIVVPVTDPVPTPLPAVAARANKFMAFDSNGNPIATVGSGGGGSGTVTSVGFTAPAGFSVSGSPITLAGTIALSWSGTIPAAQIPTFGSGVNGGVPASGGGTTNFLRADGTWAAPPGGGGGGGTVTSVSMTVPAGLTVTGAPITTSGTFAVSWSGTIPNAQIPQPTASLLGGVNSGNAPANQFMNGISTSGVPLFAQPAFSNLSGNINVSQMASGTGASSSTFWRGDGTWATPAGGGGGGSNFVYHNSAFTAASLTGYMVDTSGSAFTVTMPAGPAVGAWVQLMDVTASWGTNHVTVAGNGSNIDSSSSNMTLSIANSVVILCFVNSTIGWKVFTL